MMSLGDGKIAQDGPAWAPERSILGLLWPQNAPWKVSWAFWVWHCFGSYSAVSTYFGPYQIPKDQFGPFRAVHGCLKQLGDPSCGMYPLSPPCSHFFQPHFRHPLIQVEAEDAFILICQKKISNLQQILPVLEHIARANRPLIIVADDVDGA